MSSADVFRRSLAVCALAAIATSAFAQSAPQKVSITAADTAAAKAVTHKGISAFSKGTLGYGAAKFRTDSGDAGPRARSGHGDDQTQNPGDLGFNGGSTLQSSVQHPVYMIPAGGSPCSAAQPTTCWGDVPQFLKDLDRSEFIHITDQYVGRHGDHRYPVAGPIQVDYVPPAKPLTDADIQSVVHAAAVALGGASGLGHLYHVFLVPGQDECFDSSDAVCASNAFCAYHGFAVFPDIGEVIYSVEPFVAGVFGCNGPAGSPNGGFDDTYSVLSHETFEAITDADLSAWFNVTNSGLLGSEIGDECLFWLFDAQGNFISTNPVVQNLHGRRYAIQTEYNNAAHACTTEPGH